MKQRPIENVSHRDLSVETDLSSFGCYLCSSAVARCMYKYNSTSLGMIGESLSRNYFSSCSSTTLSHPRSLHRYSRVLAYTPLSSTNQFIKSFFKKTPSSFPSNPISQPSIPNSRPPKMCTPTEHPPAKVSSILLSYNKHNQDIHPIVIKYYAKDIKCFVDFTVKIQSTGEELKQEARGSIRSGRKYDHRSDRLDVGVRGWGERVVVVGI